MLRLVGIVGLLLSGACVPREQTQGSARKKLDVQTNSLGQKLVKLPKGTFLMGHSDFRAPVHAVSVSAFWIATTEVTNQQYDQLVKGHRRPSVSPNDNDPVTGVTKSQAERFARLLSRKEGRIYRLPTDAEWEYAARGGLEGQDFPWGSSENIGANCNSGISDGTRRARPVGSYRPNGFGLYDMVGNASEWILDTDFEFRSQTGNRLEVNPIHTVNKSLWLSRGGSFSDWYPFVWRVSPSAVLRDNEGDLCFDVGFRLVMSTR